MSASFSRYDFLITSPPALPLNLRIDVYHASGNRILVSGVRVDDFAFDRDFDSADLDCSVRGHGDATLSHFQDDLRGGFDVNLAFRRSDRYLLLRGCTLRLLYYDYLTILDMYDVISREGQILFLSAREIIDERGIYYAAIPGAFTTINKGMTVYPGFRDFSDSWCQA
jgi:hypothetical protein